MKKIIYIAITAIFVSLSANAQKVWTLQACIDHAKENNISIKIQKIAEENQRIRLNTAQNQRLPNLDATAGQNLSFGRSPSPIDNSYQTRTSNSLSFGLSTGVPIFTGFQIPTQIAIEKLNLQASLADMEKAREDIEMAVITSYLQVLLNKELHEIAKSQSLISAEQLKRLEISHQHGKASEAQVFEVKAQVANDQMVIIQSANDLSLAKLTLTQLLELQSPEDFEVETPQFDTKFALLASANEVYNNALTNRASIRAEEYKLESSRKGIKLAQSEHYPRLSLGAGYNNSFNQIKGEKNASFADQLKANEGMSLGLNLTIPIFSRFSTRNNIRAAKLNLKSQEFQLENIKKNLYKEIQQAHYNAIAAEEKFNAANIAKASSEKAYEYAKEKFENGKATSYEFDDAKNALTKALSTLSQAKYDYIFRKKILDFYSGQ